MKWIARKNVTVDRVACPWLIKTFIDPKRRPLIAGYAQGVDFEGGEEFRVSQLRLSILDRYARACSSVASVRLSVCQLSQGAPTWRWRIP